jgi:hypothetical protein
MGSCVSSKTAVVHIPKSSSQPSSENDLVKPEGNQVVLPGVPSSFSCKISTLDDHTSQKALVAAGTIEMVVTEMQKSGKSLQTIFNEYEGNNGSSNGGILRNEQFAKMLDDHMTTKNTKVVSEIVARASHNGARTLNYNTVFRQLILEFLAYHLQQKWIPACCWTN